MAYPSVITSLTNPQPTDKLNSPSHSGIETAQNTEITALETFVGTIASTAGTLIYDIRSSSSDGGGHIQGVNKGGTGQTSYNKGDLLVGSSSSVISKLAVGSNNQVLTADNTAAGGLRWNTLATGGNVATVIPYFTGEPSAPTTDTVTISSSSVLARLALFTIPTPISVNKVAIQVSTNIVQGNMRFVMYQGDGSASVLSTTVSLIGNAGVYNTTVSSVAVSAGNYWMAATSPNGSVQGVFFAYNPNENLKLANASVTAGNLIGRMSVLGGVLPPAFSPLNDIVYDTSAVPIIFRLDN